MTGSPHGAYHEYRVFEYADPPAKRGAPHVTLDELIAKRPDVPFDAALSASAIEEFHERGFTSVGRVTSDEEIAWLRQVYDLFFASETKLVPGQRVKDVLRPIDAMQDGAQSQVLKPELRLPDLCQTAFWKNGRKLAAQLLSADETSMEGWGHMVRKPAHPWHQDEAFWDTAFDYRALACWMPLDEASVESGCMNFIPGSHLQGIRHHRFLDDDPSVTALVADNVDVKLAVAQLVPVGGASFHHCRIIHGSGPNRSAQQRRAYVNEFQLAPTRREIPADRPWVKEGLNAKLAKYGALAGRKTPA
jgi:Phytanoyl-CoA dioxygenase (PhyH)